MRPISHAPVVLLGLAGAISDYINKLERDLGVDGSGLTVLFFVAVVVLITLLLVYNRASKRKALRRAHAGKFVAHDPFARSFHLQRSVVTEGVSDPRTRGPARDVSNPRYRPDVQLPTVTDPVFPSLEEVRLTALDAEKVSLVAADSFAGSGLGGSGLGASGLGGPNPLVPKAVGPGRLGPSLRGSDEFGSDQLGSGQLGSGQLGSGQLGSGQLESNQLGSSHLGSGPLGSSQLGSSPAFSIPGLPGLVGSGLNVPGMAAPEEVASDPVISGAIAQGPVVSPDPIGQSRFPTLSDTRKTYGAPTSMPEGAGVAVATSAPIPGWYEDPSGAPGSLRYWDGNAWTEHRSA